VTDYTVEIRNVLNSKIADDIKEAAQIIASDAGYPELEIYIGRNV
jgi:hypothetical protein